MSKPADDPPSVRWLHGRPHLSTSERLEVCDDKVDALIADVRENGAVLALVASSVRTGFDRLESETLRHTAELSDLRQAIGPEPSARESIHDIDEEAVAAIASRGMRGQLAALWATQIAERSARIEETKRRRAAEAEQAKAIEVTATAQKRSASLLGGLVVLVTALQESGALRALLAAVRAALGG